MGKKLAGICFAGGLLVLILTGTFLNNVWSAQTNENGGTNNADRKILNTTVQKVYDNKLIEIAKKEGIETEGKTIVFKPL